MTDATDEALQTPPQPGAVAPVEPVPRTTATSTPDEIVAAAEVVAAPEPPKEPPKAPLRVDYAAQRKQERIDRLTAEKAELARQLELARAGAGADAEARAAEITREATRLAQEEAGKIAAWNSFTGALNTAIAEGQKEFGTEKFDTSVQALRGLHDQNDPDTHQRYLNMLQAVLDTGAPAKLIAHLGEDPNEAARIMGLTPTKMGVELGKLAIRDAEEVSKAPKPITPVTGVGRNHVAIAAEDTERADGLDMRVWMERRGAHVQEVNKRAGRRVIP